MAFKMKGSPHKMGTVKGTSSYISAVKQKEESEEEKSLREQELELANKEHDLKKEKFDTDQGGKKKESSPKWKDKRNENIAAYDEEIALLEESGADQKEIDKVRRKRDKEGDKLKRGQFDWGELTKLFGDSLTGLGASWGTGRWMGGKPGTYHLRRLGDDPEADKEEVVEGGEVGENEENIANQNTESASEVAEQHASGTSLEEFNAAFAKNREEKGAGAEFEHPIGSGQMYSTNLKEEEK